MVDLRPGGGGGGFGFRVSTMQRAAPVMKRRERTRIILFVVGIALFLLVAGPPLLIYLRDGPVADPVEKEPFSERETTPAVPPDLAALPLPPPPAASQAQADQVDRLGRDPGYQRLYLRGQPLDDPLLWAWMEHRLAVDEGQGFIPRGFAVSDLVRGAARPADALFVSGLLVDLREVDRAGETWYYATVEMHTREHTPVYQVVIVPQSRTPDATAAKPSERLPLGGQVRVTGRSLGVRSFSAAEAGTTELPSMLAVAMRPMESENGGGVENLLRLGKLPEDEESLRRWSPDAEVFQQIDDITPRLESRPYYYLLGRVQQDASLPYLYDDAADGNRMSPALHDDPAAHREQIFHVEGIVWDAWVDQLVTNDRPYGIRHVHRIRCYKRIYDATYRNHDLEGNVSTNRGSLLQAYEIAAIADPDQPLPKRGWHLSTTGRFLKVRGYPADDRHPMHDAELGIRRQSDNVYFKMFIAPSYQAHPPPKPIDFTIIGWITAVIGISAVICMAVLIQRDDNDIDRHKRQIKKIRKSRRKLRRGQRRPPADADSAEHPDNDIASTSPDDVATADDEDATD